MVSVTSKCLSVITASFWSLIPFFYQNKILQLDSEQINCICFFDSASDTSNCAFPHHHIHIVTCYSPTDSLHIPGHQKIKGVCLFFSPAELSARFQNRYPIYPFNLILEIQKLEGCYVNWNILSIIDQLYEHNICDLCSNYFYESKINELIMLFLSEMDLPRLFAQKKNDVTGLDLQRIQLVIHHMKTHLSNAPNITELAKIACMSPSKLKYTFKKITHKTIGDYKKKLRLEHAKQILLSSECPIATLSLQLGYKKPASFIHFFKQMTGMTPGAFRKQDQLS